MEPSKLASLPFFQGISPEDMTKLLEELDAREVFYEKGSFLVHTGDKITAAGLVLSGEVHILREDSGAAGHWWRKSRREPFSGKPMPFWIRRQK